MSQDICQVNVIHEDRVAKADQMLPERKQVAGLAAVYKLLGDQGRLKIMLALNVCEMCVCDLAALLNSTPSAISHQLRLLRTAGLVEARMEGKVVYYNIGAEFVQSFLKAGRHYLEVSKTA
jgi:ArsR family transcriptional regulator